MMCDVGKKISSGAELKKYMAAGTSKVLFNRMIILTIYIQGLTQTYMNFLFSSVSYISLILGFGEIQ